MKRKEFIKAIGLGIITVPFVLAPPMVEAAVNDNNNQGGVSGIKGDAETEYRYGNVNLTPANLGAYNKVEVDTKVTELNTAINGKAVISHTHSAATTSAAGFMSAADKAKLNGIATGATKVTVDSSLSSSSTNPVQNKAIYSALANKAESSHNHDAKYQAKGSYAAANHNHNGVYASADHGHSSFNNISINQANPEITFYNWNGGRSRLVDWGNNQFAIEYEGAYCAFCNYDGNTWRSIKCSSVQYGSSRRIKENIEDISEERARKIFDVRTVSFDFKKQFGGEKNNVGVIAEEVLELLPEVVIVDDRYDEEKEIDYKTNPPISVDYTKFIPFIIKALQILKNKVDKFEE